MQVRSKERGVLLLGIWDNKAYMYILHIIAALLLYRVLLVNAKTEMLMLIYCVRITLYY